MSAGAVARGSSSPTSPRVVVVGAGLAGLTCAYRLHQQGVAATVFEAAPDRVGGRCWTNRRFANGQVAEHGGEFIDSRHIHIRRLADELRLPLEDRAAHEPPGDAGGLLWLDGGLRDPQQVYAGLGDVVGRLADEHRRVGGFGHSRAGDAARALDEMTAEDWLRENVDDPLLRRALAMSQSGFFGLDADQLSAITLLEAHVVHPEGADQRYHVRGGNDLMTDALARQLGPGAIRHDAPLTALGRASDGTCALRFAGVPGTVHADLVALALPFTALRDVDLTTAGLPERRMRSISELGMGTNAKHHVQLDVRPHQLDGWSGELRMDAPVPQTSWESTRGQPGPTSIITIWRGGRAGAGYPVSAPHQSHRAATDADLAAFERGVDGITDAFNGLSWVDSWVDDPWAKGSYAAFLPGQFTRYWGYLGEAHGRVHFAGEHTSTHAQGYLEGAVESGERVAREVLAAIGTMVR